MNNLHKAGIVAILAMSVSNIALAQAGAFKPIGITGASGNTTTAINNSGEVLVNVISVSSSDVMLWNQLDGSVDLGLTNAAGAALNNSGDVVGGGIDGVSKNQQAFLWSQTAGVQWLGSLGGGLSVATGVNDGGSVVGLSYTGSIFQHAFLWSQSGGMQDLTPDLTSLGGATATAINSSNEVVGYYFPNGSLSAQGFMWTQAGGLQNLGPVGTLPLAINNSGVVVGQFTSASGFQHAFSWTSSGGMQDLGTLGAGQSTALAINNQGWIVGTSMTSAGDGLLHGFLWTPTGGMQDFTTIANLASGYQMYSVGLNDAGVIALTAPAAAKVLIPIMTVSLTPSFNPAPVGTPVTFTALITSVAGPPPNGETIQFLTGGNVLGSGTITNGVAQFTISSLPAGSHAIVAEYGGDANYLSAKSASVKEIINPADSPRGNWPAPISKFAGITGRSTM